MRLLAFQILVLSAAVAAAQTTTAPADLSTPKAALKTLSAALQAGDRDKILATLHATNPAEHAVARVTADSQSPTPPSARPPSKPSARASRPLLPQADQSLNPSVPEPDSPLGQLVHVDGQWKVPVSNLTKDIQGDLDKNIHDVAEQADIIRKVTAEVLAGKYKTAIDARGAGPSHRPPRSTARHSPDDAPS